MHQQQVPHRKGGTRRGHLQDGTLPKQNGGVGAKAPRSQGGRWQLIPPGRGVTHSIPELGPALPSWPGTGGGIGAREGLKAVQGLVGMVTWVPVPFTWHQPAGWGWGQTGSTAHGSPCKRRDSLQWRARHLAAASELLPACGQGCGPRSSPSPLLSPSSGSCQSLSRACPVTACSPCRFLASE